MRLFHPNGKKKRRGITLIEIVIDAALLSMVSVVVLTSFLATLNTATKSATFEGAGQLANEKMEVLRNMSYDSLATQHGAIYPQGTVLDDENLTLNKKTFAVHTVIVYVDDPYDGTAGGTPNDLNPADYKRISITVTDPINNKQLAFLTTDIASRAAETASNTGVLKTTVLDSSGVAVNSATLTITNTTVTPQLSITTNTGSDGIIVIPNLPISGGYHVVASKGGYSTDSTLPITQANPHPTTPDASVLFQQVTSVTLTIDQLATIILHPQGLNGSTISVTLTGAKLIDANPDIPKTVLTQSISGDTTISNVEFDSYTIAPPSGWYITTCSPMQPFAVAAAATVDITCTFSNSSSDLTISKITPTQVPPANNVSFEIDGTNLNTITVSIQQGTNAEIPLPGITNDPTNTQLTGTIDFSAVPTGTYNVILRDGQGHTLTQTNGLVVQ